MKRRYFLDTEFIEDGRRIELLSLALVAQDGRLFYRQNSDCQFKSAGDWVWRNVYPHLQHFDMRGYRSCYGAPGPDSLSNARLSFCGAECPWRTHYEIRDELLQFVDLEKYGRPEFWGYYCAYDWVALCQLFGAMVDLPKGFPMYCLELKQLCLAKGDPQLPQQIGEHNALNDALWTRDTYDFLLGVTFPPP